jgi:DNA-binding NarL/FixJ family response regulator
MKSKSQIILVDDNPIFLEGLATFLNKSEDYEVIAHFTSGIELVRNINQYDPDIILLDIEMPGMNGFETAKKLSWLGNELKLIAITMYNDRIYLNKLIEAGFRGFVSKNEVTGNLMGVMDSVMKGDLVFPGISGNPGSN